VVKEESIVHGDMVMDFAVGPFQVIHAIKNCLDISEYFLPLIILPRHYKGESKGNLYNTSALSEKIMTEKSADLVSALSQWNDSSLETLGQAQIFTREDLTKLADCAPSITHAFDHMQFFRTPTEMRISVLNDISFPTADSKYWQTVREMEVMFENLVNLVFTYEEKTIDLEKAEYDLAAGIEDKFEKRKKILEIKKINWALTNIKREAHNRIREIAEWKKIQVELSDSLQYGMDNVNDHQLLSYAEQFLGSYVIALHRKGPGGEGLEAFQNITAHVITSLKHVQAAGLMPDLKARVKGNRDIMNLLKENGY
jgi:hypothetical protein